MHPDAPQRNKTYARSYARVGAQPMHVGSPPPVRVGVYIDGFNLYFGGRRLCGGSTAGWRWLNLRALAEDLISRRRNWSGATLERVVYCTAMIDRATNPVGHGEQDTYIRALRAARIVDRVEFGHYVARVKKAPLATEGTRGSR
jgi:hypothetical protein